MTPHEAAELLTLMRGTWPRLAQDEVADRLWLEDLTSRCDLQVALDAWRSLRDTEPHAPSWSTFLAAYTNAAKASRHRPPELEPAGVPKADPVRLAAHFERARAALTRPV